MQIVGVGERRYFNGHSEMVIIVLAPNGEQIDMPASVEQVGMVMQMSEAMQQARPKRASAPSAPAVAPPILQSKSPLDDDEDEVVEPIRLGAVTLEDEDGEPL